ncbi:MAG: ATP cone domain-containing protein, partial [Akkermansia sp.]
MKIIKRNGQICEYNRDNILRAIYLTFQALGTGVLPQESEMLADAVEDKLPQEAEEPLPVETVQDYLEIALMERGHFDAVKLL